MCDHKQVVTTLHIMSKNSVTDIARFFGMLLLPYIL